MVLVLNEILLVDLVIGGAKELEEVLLLVGMEVTLLEEVLMGTGLHLRLDILLSHDMSFLFDGVFILCFCWHFLYKPMVISLSFILILQDIFLLQNALHHLPGNTLVLLIIIGGPGVVLWQLRPRPGRAGQTPPGSRRLLFSVRHLWVVLSRAHLEIFFRCSHVV